MQPWQPMETLPTNTPVVIAFRDKRSAWVEIGQRLSYSQSSFEYEAAEDGLFRRVEKTQAWKYNTFNAKNAVGWMSVPNPPEAAT